MRRFAISSWSVDGLLQSGLPLLELPALMAEQQIRMLEVCHFHFPSTSPEYVQQFRNALQQADVELYSVLIDTGDIVSPDPARRAADLEAIHQWIDVAAALGARVVRISAGQQPPTPELLRQSAEQLSHFAAVAAEQNVGVITENWQRTSQEAADLLSILQQCEGKVGLCADTGNAEATADKYATLAALLPHATSIHFKAQYAPDGSLQPDDTQRCMALIEQADFDGVISLIYAGKRHEWREIARLRDALTPLL